MMKWSKLMGIVRNVLIQGNEINDVDAKAVFSPNCPARIAQL